MQQDGHTPYGGIFVFTATAPPGVAIGDRVGLPFAEHERDPDHRDGQHDAGDGALQTALHRRMRNISQKGELEVPVGLVVPAEEERLQSREVLHEEAHSVAQDLVVVLAQCELEAYREFIPRQQVVVLPNSKNVVLAAEQAAQGAGKEVRVVATRTIQAGLGALVAFDPQTSAEENAAAMEEAAAAVRSGGVARASRTATIGALEVEQGQFLGLVDGEPVTAGPALEPVAREVVERLLGSSADVLTILLGDETDSADELVEGIRTAHPLLEVEVHAGGQPHYPLLFAVE